MVINFGLALKYPYLKDNRINTTLIPGVILLGVMVATAAMDFYVRSAAPDYYPNFLGFVFALTVFVNATLAGFYWHISGTMKTKGFRAPAPSWAGHFTTFLIKGAKLLIYLLAVYYLLLQLLVNLPLMRALEYVVPTRDTALAYTVLVALLVFLGPVVAAPVIYSSGTYRFRDLCSYGKAFEALKPAYVTSVIAMGFVLLTVTIYLAGIIAVSTLLNFLGLGIGVFILIPPLVPPMIASCWHLFNQGFLSKNRELARENNKR